MRFGIPLETMFQELPMEQRFARAAECGMQGVAFLGWRNKDVTALDRARRAAKVDVPYIAAFPGWPPTSLCDPAVQDRFRLELEEALKVAELVESPLLIDISGDRQPGIPEEVQWTTLRDNLAWAAEKCAARGKTFLLENVNRYELPKILLVRFSDAVKLVEEIGNDHLRLCFDTMHVQLTEGDITHCINDHIEYIANVHLESVPDRGEPTGTGELNDRYIVQKLDDAGFKEYVIFEFTPAGRTEDSLRRVMSYLAR